MSEHETAGRRTLDVGPGGPRSKRPQNVRRLRPSAAWNLSVIAAVIAADEIAIADDAGAAVHPQRGGSPALDGAIGTRGSRR
jgi:hypothetical protein